MTDKLLYPPGYYWAPAGMEQLYNCVLRKMPFDGSFEPHFYKKTIEGSKASLSVMEGFGNRIVHSYKKDLKNAWYPGREVLVKTKFGLYNAQDKVMKTACLTQSANLGLLCHRIQDSGGFQLFSGISDFIDPIKLAQYHDTFADSGVSLDLPLSLVKNERLVKAGARMLVANSELLLKHKKAKWNLMNVSHGLTPELRRVWQKIALQEPLDSLCIAGLRGSIMATANGSNPIAVATHLLVSMLCPAKYKHYHLLGFSSSLGMTLASVIANLHQKIITSDSTTYLSGQKFKSFLNAKISNHKGNYGLLGCCCPTCNYIEYEHWMQTHPVLMSMHNAHQLLKKAELINGLAKIALAKKLKGNAIAHMFYLAKVGIDRQILPTLGFAFDLILNTTSYAQTKDLNYSLAPSSPGSLFKRKVLSEEDLTRQVKIIKTYEKYHGKIFLE